MTKAFPEHGSGTRVNHTVEGNYPQEFAEKAASFRPCAGYLLIFDNKKPTGDVNLSGSVESHKVVPGIG